RVEQYELTRLEGLTAGTSDANTPPIDTLNKPNAWLTYPVTPWRRYAARLLDIIINGSIGGGLLVFAVYALAPYTAVQWFEHSNPAIDFIVWTVITVVASSILTGITIGFTGSSIGKWIFGIRVTNQNLRPIGVAKGIVRDFSVITRGMALGIPLLSLFFMYHSYRELKQKGITFWDREQAYVVSHRPSGMFQYLLNVVGIFLIMVLQAIARTANQMF
ncbi:MAG: RDD family protein, partial [Gammaproteobacteria bacterium]|nr:RDD family protein [Gammaproteobacteria bacterium]